MSRQKYSGTCSICKKVLAKSGMSRHMATHDNLPGGIRILVSSRHMPDFWLHLAVNPEIKLSRLDQFLRDIWLECCGHLSSFEIDGKRYDSYLDDEAAEYADSDMEVVMQKVLKPGLSFFHEYDFGSTTYLLLKVISMDKEWVGEKPFVLLAKNNPLKLVCVQCGKKATQLCIGCEWEEQENTFCSACGKKHECKSGEDIWLPVVNSPRMGVCDYTG